MSWRVSAALEERQVTVRGGKAGAGLAGAGASVGRAKGPTALQSFVLASRRTTRCVRCALYAQTRSTVQLLKRVNTRADARPNLLRRHLLTARTGQPSPGFAATVGVFDGHATLVRQRRARAGGSAHLVRRGPEGLWPARAARFVNTFAAACLNEANAVSALSSAAGHEPEHRRVVGAPRRPRKLCAAACPGAPLLPQCSRAACLPTHQGFR